MPASLYPSSPQNSSSLDMPLAMPVTSVGPIDILLVDDDADLREAVKNSIAERYPCCVVEANGTAEALEEISRKRCNADINPQNTESAFDVIFIENSLTDQNGLDLLTHLRLQGDATPVVVMANAGSEGSAVEAMRRGACDYIVKSGDFVPCFPDVVSHVVERDRMRRYYSRLEAEHVRFARLAAVGEMSAGIAHEIRNPMQVVAGMAALMRDDLESLSAEEIRQCATAISENCHHLQRVLEDVLREAQPDLGKETLFLSELVDETIAFMRFDSDFRQYVTVERDFQAVGLIEGSRDQLKQVLINLLRNAAQAISAAERGVGVVCISIEENADADEVLLCIHDSGDGIPTDVLTHIFESGFSTKLRAANRHHASEETTPSAHGSTPVAGQSKIQGSGLGLHICRRLIEAHGGRIWAENTGNSTAVNAREIQDSPLKGASFCIALPRACQVK